MGKILIGIISFVGIISLFSTVFPFTLTPVQKFNFDNQCDKYFKILVSTKELTSSEISELKSNLESKDFKNVNINATYGNWGDEVVLNVTADIEIKTWSKTVIVPTTYKNSSICTALR